MTVTDGVSPSPKVGGGLSRLDPSKCATAQPRKTAALLRAKSEDTDRVDDEPGKVCDGLASTNARSA